MKKGKRSLSFLLACIVCILAIFQTMPVNASLGSVTSYERITWGVNCGKFTVNNNVAFCCQFKKKHPEAGTALTAIEPCNSKIMRKILYYGSRGPKNTLGTGAKAHVLTAIALSDAYMGEDWTGVKAKYDEFYWDVVNNPSKYPDPPSNFKTYFAVTESKWQKLVFYEMEENGYAKVLKTSTEPTVTDKNEYYSLEGAKYEVYNDASLSTSSKMGTLTTDKKGETNSLELIPGTYYLREVEAPKGFALNTEVVTFAVTAEKTTTLNLKDTPEKVDVKFFKYQEGSETPIPETVFEVTKPDGSKEEFTTDEKGSWVLGNLFYGSYEIREVSPADGYIKSEDVIRFTVDETTEKDFVIKAYNKLKPYNLVIHKTDPYEQVLAGAQFALYTDAECESEWMSGITDENGVLKFENLQVGMKYYLKEIKAPAGYKTEEKVYEIYAESLPENYELELDIINEINIILPKTGSAAGLLMILSGILLCSISIYQTMKRRKTI